jgi:hypothetical protein
LAPFTVSKNIGNMDLYLSHQGKLENLFKTVVDVEYSIKTGKYPDSYIWLTVKKLFLDFRFEKKLLYEEIDCSI